MAEITGTTRLFGILADPIHHVRTPQAVNAAAQARGYDGVLVPMHVKPENLASVVDGLRRMENLGGVIVTVPHKTAIAALCDELSPSARRIGAVNAVRREADGRLVGEMLDGAGFVRGLQVNGIDTSGMRAYLAGAGGAANAIAFALAGAGVSSLTIANRTRAKADDLKARLADAFPALPVEIGTPDPSGHHLVVNGTSLGLKDGDALPFDAERLTPDQIVAEIIMQPEETAILAAAKARGCCTHPGRPMLAEQVALMCDFLGIR
ncbi:shikimate dehydrogenase family protein [Aquabacter cavernae]|uniref:shikimate dehydrogenase family protein n=1 Tax=Aquabacter cavernae TaxID=2496029 RepID=UPI000F8D2C2D|nr:shikimate dehydrogenase [Aquabacter cavernae]